MHWAIPMQIAAGCHMTVDLLTAAEFIFLLESVAVSLIILSVNLSGCLLLKEDIILFSLMTTCPQGFVHIVMFLDLGICCVVNIHGCRLLLVMTACMLHVYLFLSYLLFSLVCCTFSHLRWNGRVISAGCKQDALWTFVINILFSDTSGKLAKLWWCQGGAK